MSEGDRTAQLRALRGIFENLTELSEDVWRAAVPNFRIREFQSGEAIIRAGELAPELGFVLSGLARYYYVSKDGREYNKSFVGVGQAVASIVSFISGEPAPFYVEAMDASTIVSIHRIAFQRLCAEHRAWEQLSGKLLAELALKKERREADFLLLTAQARYEKFLAEFGETARRIPNYHIASYLGITEVALSRIRRRMGLTHRPA